MPVSTTTLDLLTDTAQGYRHLGDRELRERYRMLRSLQYPALLKIGEWLISKWRLHHLYQPSVMQTAFQNFCGGETLAEVASTLEHLNQYHVRAVLDYAKEGAAPYEAVNRPVLEQTMANIEFAAEQAEVWGVSLKLSGLMGEAFLQQYNGCSPEQLRNEPVVQRKGRALETICERAKERQVPLSIDAEQTAVQSIIDHLAEAMIETYNHPFPVVFQTVQCYRKDKEAYVRYWIEKARQEGFQLGLKLVRGAYWEQEHKQYPALLYQEKSEADATFDRLVQRALDHLGHVHLMVATHNIDSIKKAIGGMMERGISPSDPRVQFSQLYGMGDVLTFNLARQGYQVSKYLPYGSVTDAIPYLLRRARENSAARGQVAREFDFIEQELQRRRERDKKR